MQPSEARERVLAAAQALFAERGYTAVTVKDIAQAAGIHHASLYHHAPGGKEQLFVEVTERTLRRHQQGIAAAITSSPDLRQQLVAVADWLITEAPLDLLRMVHSDMPNIQPDSAVYLMNLAYEAALVPLETALEGAQQRGEITPANLGNIAGALYSALVGLHTLPEAYLAVPRRTMAAEIIDVFLAGLRPG